MKSILKQLWAWFRWKLHPSNPSRLVTYIVTFVMVTVWCCSSSIRLWSFVSKHPVQNSTTPGILSETIVELSIGLTAIALALAIMLGEMYGEHAGRLRVFLHVSKVELSLVATVTTGVVAAVITGKFYILPVSIGLGAIAILSCSSILKVLHLLQHDEQFIEAWKTFTISRQRRIASQSASRQIAAATASATISGWGSDVKIENRFFERFHDSDLKAYIKVAAGNIGQVDTIDLSSLHRLLDMLQKREVLRADKDSPAPTHADTLTSATPGTSSNKSCSSQPLLIICYLPGSTVDDPEEGLAFFRTDARLGSDQRRTIVHALRRAFRIDNSERISETITDLQSETTELCDDLKKGIPSNDRQPVERFRQMSLGIVAAAGMIRELNTPGIIHNDYIYRVEALARATNDARLLVKNSAVQVDRGIKDLVLSLSSNLAYSAAETGNPEVFQSCLRPLKLQYQDVLQQHPSPEEIDHGLFSYSILSSMIQGLAEQNTSAKTSTEPAVAEAKILLQSLSSLLIFFARQHKWPIVTSIIKEITLLEPRSALWHNDTAPSGEYPVRFGKLMSLTYYGLHACLVDLAMGDPTASVPHELVKATWPNDDFDLPRLLSIYTQARAECADGQRWGWEESKLVSGKMSSPRTGEILVRGFVATIITWPERALFQDSDAWRTAELGKLEQAAEGTSELRQLFGTGGLLDKTLKNGDEIAKLVAATSQNQDGADRAVGALRKLLDYVQAKTADEERARIQNARVSVEAIQGWPKSVVQQYDTSREPGIAILKKLKLLLPTGIKLSGVGEEHSMFGIGDLDDKKWYLGQEPGSWTGIGKQYADSLLRGEQEVIVAWLAEISSPVELFSVVAHESHVDKSKSILVVNSNVYLLPLSLKDMVKISESANSDHEGPNAFFEISGKQIPMYQFFGQGMKSCLLFIGSSSSAHVIPIPWKAEDGWTLSKTWEVKARLRVPSQDEGAMKELLGQHAPRLEEEAHTDEEKKAYLSRLVWLEACLQLAFDAGATPSVLRLDLPSDEPDPAPQGKDKSTD